VTVTTTTVITGSTIVRMAKRELQENRTDPMQMTSTATPLANTALPLRVNFAWAVAGNLVSAAAQWLVVVILARLGGASTVGAYTIALAIAGPVFLFANLHLRTVQATDVGSEFGFSSYFTLRALTSALCMLALVAGALLLPRSVGGLLIAIAATKACESGSEILYGRLQFEERMDRIGKSMILRSLCLALMMGGALQCGLGPIPGAWGGVAGAFLVFLYDRKSLSVAGILPPGFSFDFRELVRLARLAAPLAVVLLFMSLNTNIPRYLLASLTSEREVGLFSALGYVALAANTLVMALGQASSPSLAKSYARLDTRRFSRDAAMLILLAVGLGSAGVLAALVYGERLVTFLYGPEFSSEQRAFRWLMLSGGLSYFAASLGYLLSSMRCFRQQVPLLAAATVTTAICGYWLIPTRGVYGAAMAQLAGCAVQVLLGLALVLFLSVNRFCRGSHAHA